MMLLPTSGSTGLPKLIIVTDQMVLRGCTAPKFGKRSVLLSFQPIRQSWDMLLKGGQIGVWSGQLSRMHFDMALLRPTVVGSTPAYFQSLRQAFVAELDARVSGSRTANYNNNRDELTAEWRAKRLLGNRCEAVILTGAAVGDGLKRWIFDTLGALVLNGYGATEVGGLSHDTAVHSSAELQLIDAPELGYTSSDMPYPRGELVAWTPRMTPGYYGDQEQTDAAFVTIGGKRFFRTGDIAQLQRGRVVILDRRSAVFKLANGRFVAPAVLEAVYQDSPLVVAVLVHGTSTDRAVEAVVVPDPDLAGPCRGAADASAAESLLRLTRSVLRSLREIGEAAGLQDYEIPRRITLELEPWTADNGMLTSTAKLCRPKLLERYRLEAATAAPTAPTPTSASSSRGGINGGPGGGGLCSALLVALRATMPNLPDDDADVSGEQSLFELGCDSIACARFCSVVQERFGVELSVATLGRYANLFELQSRLFGNVSHGTATCLDFEAIAREEIAAMRLQLLDGVIDDRSSPALLDTGAAPTILLTGATGFVGTFLLHRLLRSEALLSLYPSPVRVVCLVRAGSAGEARRRIADGLRYYQLDGALVPEGNTATEWSVLLGDLGAPGLGLADADRGALVRDLVSVVHCGAHVHAIHSFGRLRAPNVTATRALCVLALEARASLHHVSTIGIMNGSGVSAEVAEVPPSGISTASGYSQSKWVAEQVVRHAGAQLGLRSAMYRLGSVGPAADTGACNPNDIVTRIALGSIELGAICIDDDTPLPAMFPLIPVDRCADAVVAGLCTELANTAASASSGPGRWPQVFHVTGSTAPGVTIAMLHAAIADVVGSGTVRTVGREGYRRAILTLEPQSPLFPYTSVLAGVGYRNGSAGEGPAVFCDVNTQRLLHDRRSIGAIDVRALPEPATLGPAPVYTAAQLAAAVRFCIAARAQSLAARVAE